MRRTQKLRVDIWSAIACPWCHVGKRRFEAALAKLAHRDEVENGKRGQARGRLRADEREAAELGVTGVPFFVVGRYAISGAQPKEVFERALDLAWKEHSEAKTVETFAEGVACGPEGCA
ncbi:MAG: DsbA family protein [Labilithrix sp.]